VIDSRRSGRFTLDELEKTERTYIGTKVEILLRHFLNLDRGSLLDLTLDGIEVDVKNTIRSNWTIPLEAVGHPCILIRADERRARCWFGLLIVTELCLNKGKNRDQKRSISRDGIIKIRWMLENEPYPANFWEQITPEEKKIIISPRGGTARVAALFSTLQGRRIPRNIVEALAQQDDSLKRIRRNGGARDLLAPRGIAILWGGKDQALIERLGLPRCTRDEFVSFKPTEAADIALLRDARHID